jgi:hypothetical protein
LHARTVRIASRTDGGLHVVPPGEALRTGYVVADVPGDLTTAYVVATVARLVVRLRWDAITGAEEGAIVTVDAAVARQEGTGS